MHELTQDVMRGNSPARIRHVLQVRVTPHRDSTRWQAEVRTPRGDWLRLHSARDPLAEARGHVAAIAEALESSRRVVLIGIGLGYALEAVLDAHPGVSVVVVEPVSELLAAARARVPAVFATKRVHVVAADDEPGIADLWRLFDEDSDREPPILIHPVLERVSPELGDVAAAVHRAIFNGRANARARRDHGGRYLLNTLRNLDVLAASGDVATLFDAFPGTPAVIVGAGPSLDRNIEELGAVADRALLIAVDTALRPLLTHGIEPHLVVALDPSDLNARHLLHLPPCSRAVLVAEPSVDPRAFAAFGDRVLTFRVADHHPWPWLRAQGLDRARLDVWGSVLTAAFDLALRAGCDPIVFAGADLAFSGGRTYCRGTVWEEDWARHAATGCTIQEIWRADVQRRPTVRCEDILGRDVDTAAHLVSFRDWLVARAARSGRTVANGSGAGILRGPGIRQQTLREFAAENAAGSSVTVTVPAPNGQPRAVAPGRAEIATWAAQCRASADDIQSALHAPSREKSISSNGSRDLVTLPERTLMLRDALRRGTSSRAPAPAGAAERARTVAANLLRSQRPIARSCAGSLDPAQPVWAQFEWHPSATDDAFLLHRLSAAVAGSSILAALPHDGYLCGPARTKEKPGTGVDTRARQVDLAARVLVALQAGWLQPSGRDDAERQRGLRLLVRTAVLLNGNWVPDGGCERRTAELPAAESMVALTGLVASDRLNAGTREGVIAGLFGVEDRLPLDVVPSRPGPGDPRARFRGTGLRFIEPVPLVARGLPPSYCAYIQDGRSAVIASAGLPHAFYIHEDGTFEPGRAWPGPISGEIPWGSNGGALAWHAYPPFRIMLRESAEAPVATWEVPFAAFRVLVEPDGTTLWASYEGGLWSWRPESGAALVADTPPVIGIRRRGGSVRLDPVLRDADGAFRYDTPRVALMWDSAAHALSTVPLDEDGPCWSESTSDDWTASACDLTDQVLLVDRDGRRLRLACETATSAAWAGRSLVVTTRVGDVLFFPRLADRLRDWTAGAECDVPPASAREGSEPS